MKTYYFNENNDPKGKLVQFYNYDGHRTITVYDGDKSMIDAFNITRYDLEERYQEKGEPYDEDYVKEQVVEHYKAGKRYPFI